MMPSSEPVFVKISYEEAVKDAESTSEKLLNAMENLGFVLITDVPDFDEDELLRITKSFFQLPETDKMKIAKRVFKQDNPNNFRGYFPVIPGGHSLKEVFEIGSNNSEKPNKVRYTNDGRPYMQDIITEPNIWPIFPTSEQKDEFKQTMTKYYKIYEELAMLILRQFALGLHFDYSFFEKKFSSGENMATLRLIHYPPRDDSNMHNGALDPEDGAVLTTGAHVDSSMVTLLNTFSKPGLQVKYQSKWYDVPCVKNAVVMNIGKLLEALLESKIPATEHRVIDTGVDRYSAPFFMECKFEAELGVSAFGNEVKGLVADRYGPWMTATTSQYVEYSSTDFGVAVFEQ